MHTIEILYRNDASKTVSHEIDMRDHVSMSIQIKGLTGGTTATLYGTLFEGPVSKTGGTSGPTNARGIDYLPVSICGSTTITSDGIYVVPPYFRYYKLHINRVAPANVTAYFYAAKQGAFLQDNFCDQSSSSSDSIFDVIREGTQNSLLVSQEITTTTYEDLPPTLTYTPSDEVYLTHMAFSAKGSGGVSVQVVQDVNGVEEVLYQFSLTGFSPNSIDPVYFLYKVEHGANPVTLKLKAKKFISDYSACLFGRVTVMSRTI